ncbi:hypothetical protein ACIGW7_34750 [Streptomyces sp. NPDC053253]|uniref:hypothetical protein n=1 Tax=Streptomyces sp. NPDC053253 TaxID=3365699 RepID=UPI0037D39188
MSWQMALDYIKVLIWPIVVLTLGIVLREKISSILRRVNSVETPFGTATFENQVDAVAEEAGEIATSIQEEVSAAEIESSGSDREEREAEGEEAALDSLTAEKSIDVFSDLLVLADSDATAAVLGAWREVDVAIRRETVKRGLFQMRPRNLTPSDVLSPQMARSVTDLSELRDRVVRTGDVIPTVTGARGYVRAAKRIVDALALVNDPSLQRRRYHEDVLAALSSHGIYVLKNDRDFGVDAYCETEGGGAFAAEVLFRRRRLVMRDVERVVSSLSELSSGALILTNAPLGDDVREFNAASSDKKPRLEVFQWRNPDDDHALLRAVGRVAGLGGDGRESLGALIHGGESAAD